REPADGAQAGPRLRLARHRHAVEPAESRAVRRDRRGPPGPADRQPRGSRLAHGLYRRCRPRTPDRAPEGLRIRQISAAFAGPRLTSGPRASSAPGLLSALEARGPKP